MLSLEIENLRSEIDDRALSASKQFWQMTTEADPVLSGKVFVQPGVSIPLHHLPRHRIRAPTVLVENFRNDRATDPGFQHRDPEVPIFAAAAHLFIEPTDRVKALASHQCRAVDNVGVEQGRQITSIGFPFPMLIAKGSEPVRDEPDSVVFL